MKKTRLIKSIGLLSALAMPMASITTLASCSKKNYADLVSEMKDSCTSKFIEISRNVHRNVWNEGEAFKFVKKEMMSLGYEEPSGYDDWTQLNAVKRARAIELEELKKEGEENFGDYGNIWYDIKPTPGFENTPKVILHCHMDSQMVFDSVATHTAWAKNADLPDSCVNVDFDRENELMIAKDHKTSLGADGGVGIAVLLTFAKYQNRFNHGGVRLLFAAGESEAIGEYKDDTHEYPEYAAGFSLLEYDQLHQKPKGEELEFWHGTKPFGDKDGEFKYIISTSGVTKNTIFVSSSGIHECAIHSPTDGVLLNDLDASRFKDTNKIGNKIDWTETVPVPGETEHKAKTLYKMSVSGLHGGTSSTYIDKGLGNAIYILYRTLYSGDEDMHIIGGSSTPDNNAYSIARSAEVTFASHYTKEIWQAKIDALKPSYKTKFPNEDWANVKIELTVLPEKPVYGMSKQQTRDYIRMLSNDLYYGVINWFDNGEVKTSTNFGPAAIHINQSNGRLDFDLHTVERSSDKLHLEIFKNLTHSIFNDDLDSLFGSTEETGWQEKRISHVVDPVWEAPAPGENVLATAFEKAYSNFGIRYKVANEHAWLEVACAPDIYEAVGFKQPHIALIGAQVENNHSRDEVLYTDSFNSLIETIVYVLDNADSLLPK